MNNIHYLKRLNYIGETETNLKSLTELQRRHLLAIPFENLDIHSNKTIELSINRIYQKIIENKRGGICYELNGLFCAFLISLNFNVKIISARVYDKEKGYESEFDHLALIVKIDNEEYLSDVGFGEFAFEPLKLALNKEKKDPRGTFIIDRYDDTYLRVNKIINGISNPQYIFETTERKLSDFKEMCEYHQTSPHSHFTKKRIITRPTRNGRITISGNSLKIIEKDLIDEREIKNEFDDILWEWFKMKI